MDAERGANLTSMMQNIGGPRKVKKRLLYCVDQLQILYAAPVWADALKIKKLRQLLGSVQKRYSLRITCAYRTTLESAALVLGSTPPINFLAWESKKVNWIMKNWEEKPNGENKATVKNQAKDEIRDKQIVKWQERWNNEAVSMPVCRDCT